MPSRDVSEGDIVYVRAEVLQAHSDAFQVQVSDYPKMVFTHWVPAGECAKLEDLPRLRPRRGPKGIA